MSFFFFISSRRRHTRFSRDWSSDVCSSDLPGRGQRGHDEGPGGVVDDAGEHGAEDLAEAEGGRHHRESASWIPRGDPAGPGEAEGGDPHEGGSEERGGEENAGRANP